MRRLHHQVAALVFLGIAVFVTALCFRTTAIAISAPQSQTQSPQAPAAAFHEEVIAEITPGSTYEAAFVGNKHLAWVEKRVSTRVVLLDGKGQGGAYDEVKNLSFNDVESHFAFIGKRNSSRVLVLDGQVTAFPSSVNRTPVNVS